MSGSKHTRGQRLMGKIGAAAVIATLAGVPSDVAHWFAGDHDTSSMALAGKPPKPPPPPPPPPPGDPQKPLPESLNLPPSTFWFADWHEQTAPAPANFFATPTTYLGIPFVQTQLNGSATIGKPLGIKVEVPLTGAQATQLFSTQYNNNKAISYVFADFEQGSTAQIITNVFGLVNQVRSSSWSTNAYVGQYALTPVPNDGFRRGPAPFSEMQYKASRVNMANTDLYPGSGDYRNTSTGDWENPNIRTGLFIAPIGRMTAVQDKLNKNYQGDNPPAHISETGLNYHKQIPWVTRFNNWGNSSLDNADLPGIQYVFQPGAPLNNGIVNLSPAQTANQMLGRGDFSAQILHYRMRGAYSVNLFEPGVVGYTKQQMQQDVRDGWFNHSWNDRTNQIFAQQDSKPASMTLNPIVDGTTAGAGFRSEQTGTIWSGQYSLSLANPNSNAGNGNDKNRGALDILVSNLDTVDHLVKFGSGETPYDIFLVKNDKGYTYAGDGLAASRNYLIEAGMHKLLQFDLVKTRVYNSLADFNSGSNAANRYQTQTIWLLNSEYNVFGGNDRNEMGIPEPTTFGALAAAGAVAVVCRRQRRKAN